MELYLDSANLPEIENAFKLGFLTGLTTTPTFMHREGYNDVDSIILKLSKIVPILQIEALGRTSDEIISEAHRQNDLGLDKNKTVYKIPVSLEGAKACHILRSEGYMVNMHLIYTIQQAYIAMQAGATYVCPLVGRLQDQGHDALSLVEQCVNAVNKYGYPSKIMFSSVRNPEHVRNALNIGCHTITVPWKVLQLLPQNNFTTLGTEQFFEDTRLMTMKVKDVYRTENACISFNSTINEALVKMTLSKLGAVTVVKEDGNIYGVFTDGDLRRLVEKEGDSVLTKKLSQLPEKQPVTIDKEAYLIDSSKLFKQYKIDTLVVTSDGKPCGMLDIQDLL
ncbi:MAG: CBS domain-containing protein [Bacteroidales bacterium]|jgi:TalC/MipB family fructose-6-phosphate aldolase|nr:CBS domain-containing protein [Bacteroidales bacterium]MBQ5403621.1 CBS domain-containing protein [Bacteroidales bacterium]MBR6279441.1 CBS domain-containing protein [Bacteroidales bacterium]